MNNNDHNDLNESIITLRDFIDTYIRRTYTNDIVDIAKKSGLSKYIPKNLNFWRNGDFNYENHVLNFLLKVFENESVEIIQILLQNIFNEIKKFELCQRYEKGCPKPKEEHYDESVCYSCTDFIDNNGIIIFNKTLKKLGFLIDDDGFVKIIEDKTVDISKDLDSIKEKTVSVNIEKLLTEDIRKKGQQMAEVYCYLYNIENSIRKFLELVFSKEIGEDWENKITISSSVKQKIDGRKIAEGKTKWLPLRGNNILYYMDFKELGKIIINNWDVFKDYFPTQEFIKSKIQELYDCRVLIAHNSYIEDENIDLIRSYFKQLLTQFTKGLDL